MSTPTIHITHHPSSDQVKVSVQENRSIEAMWMSTAAYKALAEAIIKDTEKKKP